jgi:acetyltransferase
MPQPSPATDLAAWERHITLPDGHGVHIRPIRPEDETLYAPFFAAVTADDARLRFFAPLGQLSHERVAQFTHLDYAHAMAFIALDEATGAMLGVARLHNNAADDSGEYAIIIRSDLKSHGLGWQLMRLIIAYARARGLRSIEGKVLHENVAMLKMCREFGFDIDLDARDASICNVRLQL